MPKINCDLLLATIRRLTDGTNILTEAVAFKDQGLTASVTSLGGAARVSVYLDDNGQERVTFAVYDGAKNAHHVLYDGPLAYVSEDDFAAERAAERRAANCPWPAKAA